MAAPDPERLKSFTRTLQGRGMRGHLKLVQIGPIFRMQTCYRWLTVGTRQSCKYHRRTQEQSQHAQSLSPLYIVFT